MVGVGPFIPQKDTRFRDFPPPTARRTLTVLSLVRLMLPDGCCCRRPPLWAPWTRRGAKKG